MRTTLKIGGFVIAMLVAAVGTAAAQTDTTTALGAVLHRSCGDCHSNTMKSGWYTRVPPFSSIMSHAASEARKVMNLSEWTRYTPEQQRAFLLASCTDVTSGKMPGDAYLRFRGDARLSAQDIATVCSAAQTADTAANAAPQTRKEP